MLSVVLILAFASHVSAQTFGLGESPPIAKTVLSDASYSSAPVFVITPIQAIPKIQQNVYSGEAVRPGWLSVPAQTYTYRTPVSTINYLAPTLNTGQAIPDINPLWPYIIGYSKHH